MNNPLQNQSLSTRSSTLKTKTLTLAIEHLPCCALSFAAGFVGLPILNHNPVLELGFALGGAVTGEYVGGIIFNHHHASGLQSNIKRYGIALAFGIASWGIHQQVFHEHHHAQQKNHNNKHADPHDLHYHRR